MKKNIILCSLAIMLLLFVTACSKTEDSNVLRVGMDLKYYPFTGVDKAGNPSGIEVDISKALGKYLEYEVEIINTEFSMLIPALQSGDIDIAIGTIAITEEREKAVDFSKPYMYDKVVALVNKDFAKENNITNDISVDEFFSIKKANFAGLTGTIAVSIPESYGHEVMGVTTSAAAEKEVTSGTSDALLGSYMVYGMHATNPDTTVVYENPIDLLGLGIAVKQGNSELLNKINQFIDQMESSGLNKELKKNWDVEIAKKLFDDSKTLDYYLKK